MGNTLGTKIFLKLLHRRDEYLATNSRVAKARIAHEVINEIRSLNPPGRFLERARGKNRKGESLWTIVKDEKKCTEKVKQACRETWHRKDVRGQAKNLLTLRGSINMKSGSKRKQEALHNMYPTKK